MGFSTAACCFQRHQVVLWSQRNLYKKRVYSARLRVPFFQSATTWSKIDLSPLSVFWSLRFFVRETRPWSSQQVSVTSLKSTAPLTDGKWTFGLRCLRSVFVFQTSSPQKSSMTMLSSYLFEKTMSQLRVQFEFMGQFNVFVFLDGPTSGLLFTVTPAEYFSHMSIFF